MCRRKRCFIPNNMHPSTCPHTLGCMLTLLAPSPVAPTRTGTHNGYGRLVKHVHAQAQVLALNRRIQAQNRAPEDFPSFIRTGFDVRVVGEGYKTTPSGWVV